ncbi:HD-GYP domain-containing protein [Bdellovibrio sp. HCB2-146]|uniref:HD-GYP domain-containing protein n=1 Tax=Bdellovibrio sp. HCB2-146 TaxID=3394362 RepID=UPI0039BCD9E7
MTTTLGKTVDVLIGSPRDSFYETVKVVLKGYYPYKLQPFKSVDTLLEQTSNSEFKPILALIDGQDGTQATNEWVQSTKMSYPECHIIVLHSAAAPLDFNIVKKNGADEVMHLNFDREFISDMILQLAPIDMEGDQIPITALTPVDLRDIEAGVSINFDVYAHLHANHRSVVLRKAGDCIDARHIEKFHTMKQQMYIKKTQLKQFFEYARTVMSMRDIPFPISMTEKFHRSKKAIYEIMTQFLNGASTDYQEGKLIYEKCKAIIADFELTKDLAPNELVDEICRFSGNLRTYYHDCICMSAYGAYFAQLLGWPAEKREAAAIAGLLHNIGLSQLPPAAGDKMPKEMTAEELAEYHKYPDRSVVMVKSKKVPLDQIIAEGIGQHRENMRGSGFPKKLTGPDISEIGKLMMVAYHFHEMTALHDNRAAATPAQAVTLLRDNAMTGNGDIDLITATAIFKKFKP